MEYRFYYPDFRIHKNHTLESKELDKAEKEKKKDLITGEKK